MKIFHITHDITTSCNDKFYGRCFIDLPSYEGGAIDDDAFLEDPESYPLNDLLISNNRIYKALYTLYLVYTILSPHEIISVFSK